MRSWIIFAKFFAKSKWNWWFSQKFCENRQSLVIFAETKFREILTKTWNFAFLQKLKWHFRFHPSHGIIVLHSNSDSPSFLPLLLLHVRAVIFLFLDLIVILLFFIRSTNSIFILFSEDLNFKSYVSPFLVFLRDFASIFYMILMFFVVFNTFFF